MEETLMAAWATGLFEGEGHISITYRGDSKYVRLGLGMSDIDVINRFAAWARCGGVVIEERPGELKTMYRWQVGKKDEVSRLLKTMLPYLGERRSIKALEAIAIAAEPARYKGQKQRTHCFRGHEFTSENTYIRRDGRLCRICMKNSRRERNASK